MDYVNGWCGMWHAWSEVLSWFVAGVEGKAVVYVDGEVSGLRVGCFKAGVGVSEVRLRSWPTAAAIL